MTSALLPKSVSAPLPNPPSPVITLPVVRSPNTTLSRSSSAENSLKYSTLTVAVLVLLPSDTVYSKVTKPEKSVSGVSVTIPLLRDTLAPLVALATPTTVSTSFSASVSFANSVVVLTVNVSPL